MVWTLPEGFAGSISIGSVAWGSWPLGPEGTSGAWDPVACWLLGPEVGPEFGIHMPLGPQDPREPLGAGTPFGVWGSRWALRSGPQKPLDLVALLQGPGLGTHIIL
jgi:hypothetical protein